MLYPGAWLQVLWCRMTHTGIETTATISGPSDRGVTTTTIYTRCLQCGRAR